MPEPLTVGSLIASAWAAKEFLGPTFDAVGGDLKNLYAAGRDRIVCRAVGKVEDLEDGKVANLRVARDVLWHGAFSESEISTEYYAGLLASSRSETGLDDDAAPFVDLVKSLSSRQLRLHYDLYSSMEHALLNGDGPRGMSPYVFDAAGGDRVRGGVQPG